VGLGWQADRVRGVVAQILKEVQFTAPAHVYLRTDHYKHTMLTLYPCID
jgi:hypothetical protein